MDCDIFLYVESSIHDAITFISGLAAPLQRDFTVTSHFFAGTVAADESASGHKFAQYYGSATLNLPATIYLVFHGRIIPKMLQFVQFKMTF